MNYTISKQELARLFDARKMQVAKADAAHRKEYGEGLKGSPAIALVEIVNGSVETRLLRVELLAGWARNLKQDDLEISFEPGAVRLNQGGQWAGGSFLKVLDVLAVDPEASLTPIRLVEGQPEAGRFIVQFDEAAGKAGREELRALKKQEVFRRRVSALAHVNRTARNELLRGAREYLSAQRLLQETTLPQAVERAKRIRDAKRLLASAVRSIEKAGEVPAVDWIPAQLNTEQRDGTAYRVTFPRLEFKQMGADWLARVAAVKAYKPRMVKPRWGYSDPIPTYGPKFTRLQDDATRARERLVSSLRREFHSWAEKQGIECAAFSLDNDYDGCVRSYSLARQTVKAWPAVKEKLAAVYVCAWQDLRDFSRLKFEPGEYRGCIVSRAEGGFRAEKVLASGETVCASGDSPGVALAKCLKLAEGQES